MKTKTIPVSGAIQPVTYREFASSKWETHVGSVISEAQVTLMVNGEAWLSFMCTPTDLEALSVGFLYNEGIIQAVEDVASIHVCSSLTYLDVWLNHEAVKPEHWRRTSGCTGGVTSVQAVLAKHKAPRLYDGVVYAPTQIGKLVEKLYASQDLYQQSGGVHTSALSDGRDFYALAEDIGRHNTLDKIAGKCLLGRIDLPQRVLITTGRISSEMLQKAAHIGAAMVISRTAPSSLAVELAEAWGITMIGYARRDHFRIYTHAERISEQVYD